MKHRFLLHSLNHTIVVVDITQFGVTSEIAQRTGNPEMAPALRFITWEEAKEYFRAQGAKEDSIQEAHAALERSSVAVMTVV